MRIHSSKGASRPVRRILKRGATFWEETFQGKKSEFNKLNVINGVRVSGLRKRDGPGASHVRAITRWG